MTKTVITTDSGSNPVNMENMIPCIIIDSNDKNYYDMKKINSETNIEVINNLEVFKRAVSGERFHTSSPNFEDYRLVMTDFLEKGYNVVHIAMSSGISAGSVNTACIVANELNEEYGENRVNIIDSLTGGSGGTVLNDYANDLVKKELTTKEIVEELEKVKKELLTSFYISKVEGFVKSGRAPVGVTLSDILSFRYRIDVKENGKLFPNLPVLRGNINVQFMKWLKTLVNENNIHKYNPYYISLLKTQLKEIDIDNAINYLKSFNYFKTDIQVHEFYGAICSYGVEDQIGIGLIKKYK